MRIFGRKREITGRQEINNKIMKKITLFEAL
jgi:hypothetical protein